MNKILTLVLTGLLLAAGVVFLCIAIIEKETPNMFFVAAYACIIAGNVMNMIRVRLKNKSMA